MEQIPTTKYKELANFVHMEVHVVRRVPNYKPTQMEWNIARSVAKAFKDECDECRDKWLEYEKQKSQPKENKQPGLFGDLHD